MKKLLAVVFCLLLMVAVFGCGQKEGEQPGDTGAAGHPDEVADSTRLDSAAETMDTMMDTLAGEAEGAMEEATEETGH
jgi:hypothetical protein